MSMNPDAGRCIQAAHRVQSVMRDEFDDLRPPDVCFVYQLLLQQYLTQAWKLFSEDEDET